MKKKTVLLISLVMFIVAEIIILYNFKDRNFTNDNDINIDKNSTLVKELYDMVASSQAEIQTIGAAVENLLLAAANMGYGACYMTGPIHSRDKIYEVMGHDETKGELMALIPVGVPEDMSAPQPPRLPLEDVVTFID